MIDGVVPGTSSRVDAGTSGLPSDPSGYGALSREPDRSRAGEPRIARARRGGRIAGGPLRPARALGAGVSGPDDVQLGLHELVPRSRLAAIRVGASSAPVRTGSRAATLARHLAPSFARRRADR